MVAAVAWVVFFFVPVHPVIIDLALVLSIAFSFAVLLTAVKVKRWSDLRTFPLILLYSTLFRIGLNLATTRKIISGESPGAVIESAGHVIVADQVLIGLVMFIIIIVVQFIIANGASRFGEVAARFALDGLPGKQMSIDNELAQGAIDEATAKKRKRDLELQTDFYGNLDGAGKYIKGDVWASVVMIIINLIVGLIVGMVTLGMTFPEAAKKFTLLTIGDGVLNIICALIITFSGALVMAKVEEEDQEKEDTDVNILQKILREVVPNSQNLYIVGTVLVLLSFTPLPFFQLFIPGVAILAGAVYMHRIERVAKKAAYEEKKSELDSLASQEPQLIKVTHQIDDIRLEVGYKLAGLFNGSSPGETVQNHVLKMRQMFAEMYGIEIPAIKIKDDVSLYPATKYVIKIKESAVAEGVLKEGRVLAVPTSLVIGELEGEATKDPVYGSDAIWIEESQLDEATALGYDVWDPLTIIASHLHVMILQHVHGLVDLQKVSDMVEAVGQQKPVLKKMLDKLDDMHMLHKVIVALLKDKVSIKDLSTILEGYLDARRSTEELDTIVGVVRQRISRQLCEMNVNRDGVLYAVMLDSVLEEKMRPKNHGGVYLLDLPRDVQEQLIRSIKEEFAGAKSLHIEPVLVVHNPELRPALSRLIQNYEVAVNVLSVYEIAPSVKNKIIGTVSISEGN